MRFIGFLIVLGYLSASGPALAQNQEGCTCFVKGIVLDQESRQALPGAIVLIKETGQGTVTDASGAYRIDKLCQGNYTLVSHIIGYKEVQVRLALNHAVAEQDFFLNEESIHLNDVNVTAQKSNALSSQAVTSLEGRELDQTRGQSLGEALRTLAGVTTLQTGSSIAKPVIHGFHSNRVLLLNNGIRQEGQQWGSEHAPEIDPFVATRLSVIKGASGVRYGPDAIGGVILIEPGPLPTLPGIHGELNAVGFTNGRQGVISLQTEGATRATTTRKNAQLSWRLQGTLKRGGNIRTPTYFLDNTGVAEQNVSGAVGYRIGRITSDLYYSRFATDIGIYSGSHIGSVTDLLAVLQSGRPFVTSGFSYTIGRPYQHITHDLLKWRTVYKPRHGDIWTLTVARQYDDRMEYDLNRPRNDSLAALNRPELRFRLTSFTSDLVYEHKPIGRLNGQLGINALYQFNIMNGRPLIPNFRTYQGGVFWIEKLRHKQWEYEAGLRFDYRHMQVFRYENRVLTNPVFTFANGSGTVGVTYAPSERWTSRVNFGTSWRAPNISELFSDGVHHGAAAFEEGDQTLRPETAYNLTWNVQYTRPRVRAEFDAFYNHINDYIYLKPQAEARLTIRGAFPYFKYTQTNALYTGFDATVSVDVWRGLQWTSKLAYLYVQDLKQDQPLVWIPPNRWENGLRYEWAAVSRLQDAYVGVSNLAVARQKRVPPNSDFVAPPPAYALWGLSAGGTLPLGDTHKLELNLTVTNLFNTVYRDYLNRFRYYADDIGRNVALRVKWKF